jgi:hypothetical protein
MKKSILIIYAILFTNSWLLAQNNESVTVKAGTNVKDYFPAADRYLYSDFTEGKAILTNDRIIPSMYNYNFLSGEMEFIKSNDTLFITNKKDLISIVVARDTFYYHSGYLQLIRSGQLKVYLKQSIVMKDIQKKGAMGTINRSAASESYDYFLDGHLSRDLVADIDMVLQKAEVYFFSTAGEEFIPFNKKNLIKVMPENKYFIMNYIKLNKTDFKSREDLLNLADYVSKLQSEKS